MGQDFKRYQTGELFKVTQRTANEMVATAEEHARRSLDPGLSGGTPTYRFEGSILLCQNDTGGDLARFSVVGLDTVLITPTQNLTEFQNYPRFSLKTPLVPTHQGRWGICVEPMAAGALGQVLVSGVAPVQIQASGAKAGGFADIAHGQTYLVPSAAGAAQILWVDGGSSQVWALVRLPMPGLSLFTGTLHSDLLDTDGAALCDLRTASGASLPGGPFWAYNLMADSGPAGAAVLVMPNPGYLLWAWEGISPYGPPYMIIRVKPSAMIVTTGAAYDTSTGAFTRTTATIAAAARSDAIADNGQVTGLHETTTSYVSLAPTSNDLQRDDTTTTITGVSPASIVWQQPFTVNYQVAHTAGAANPQSPAMSWMNLGTNIKLFARVPGTTGWTPVPMDSCTGLDGSGSGSLTASQLPWRLFGSNMSVDLSVQYLGDANYNASQSSASTGALTVGPGSLTVTLTVTDIQPDPNSGGPVTPPTGYDSTYGDQLEIDVSVSVNSPGGGTFLGQIWLCETYPTEDIPLAKHGYNNPTFLISTLRAGSHNLKVRCLFDGNFAEADAIACNVCQQTITLTCDDKTRLYGDANPAWTYSIDDSALRCGDTEDAIRTTGTPAFTTSAGQTTGVGTYPVSLAAGTLCPANYALQFVDGNLTVSPAPLTVTADAKTMVHGSAVPALTGTVSGIKNSDAINFSGSTIATTSSAAGSYVITATAAAASGVLANYTLTIHNAALTIT